MKSVDNVEWDQLVKNLYRNPEIYVHTEYDDAGQTDRFCKVYHTVGDCISNITIRVIKNCGYAQKTRNSKEYIHLKEGWCYAPDAIAREISDTTGIELTARSL